MLGRCGVELKYVIQNLLLSGNDVSGHHTIHLLSRWHNQAIIMLLYQFPSLCQTHDHSLRVGSSLTHSEPGACVEGQRALSWTTATARHNSRVAVIHMALRHVIVRAATLLWRSHHTGPGCYCLLGSSHPVTLHIFFFLFTTHKYFNTARF